MALFTPGSLAGQISGSIGADCFSHNRFGPYIRRRSIPTNPKTPAQLAIRSYTATNSSGWSSLGVVPQRAWKTWAQNNPITNKLGLTQNLDGHQAYVKLNNILSSILQPNIILPPVGMAPNGCSSITLTADIGSGTCQVVFLPAPLDAGQMLCVDACVVNSAGISNVNNLWKRIITGLDATVSPLPIKGSLEWFFGTLSVGQVVWTRVFVVGSLTGLQSAPLVASKTVTNTP